MTADLLEQLLACVHQPNPTDKTLWHVAPGKVKAFSSVIAKLRHEPRAPKPEHCVSPNCNPADQLEGGCCGWIEGGAWFETESNTCLTLCDADSVAALVAAMDQLLDDMGPDGRSVCLAAKAQARIAFEPFRDKDDDDSRLMSLDLARQVEKESDQ